MESPRSDRRRTKRVTLTVRIRLGVITDGILMNMSEGGALVRIRRSQEPDRQVTLTIYEGDDALDVPARIVRSTPVQLQTESATLARTEFHVALEFLASSEFSGQAVQTILERYRTELSN